MITFKDVCTPGLFGPLDTVDFTIVFDDIVKTEDIDVEAPPVSKRAIDAGIVLLKTGPHCDRNPLTWMLKQVDENYEQNLVAALKSDASTEVIDMDNFCKIVRTSLQITLLVVNAQLVACKLPEGVACEQVNTVYGPIPIET